MSPNLKKSIKLWFDPYDSANYTNNALNQVTGRTVPGYVNVMGSANSGATVTVNLQRAYRHGSYFQDEFSVVNTSAAIWQGITNLAVLNDGSNPDIVTRNRGHIFVAKTPEAYSYDADGNLTQDGRWIYTLDAENRLVKMESRTDAPAGSKLRLEFAYDYQGRRIQKIVSTNNASGNYLGQCTNRFVYDGWNLIAEFLSLSPQPTTLIRSYVWGLDLSGSQQGAGGVGGLLWITSSSVALGEGGTHFACFDGNGNISALANAADGSLSAVYEYGPFGEVLRMTGPMAKANPFRFSTKYQDDETDLLYYGYRYYNPSTGRWLSRDPLEEDGGLNIYGFCNNNPNVSWDHLGEFIDAEHGTGQHYWGFGIDALAWNFGESVYCWDHGFALTRTSMQHADGTIPGDWTLNDAEVGIIKETLTYKNYIRKLQSELKQSIHSSVSNWKSPTDGMNFGDYDRHSDAYNAIGEFSIYAVGDVCYSGDEDFIFKGKIYLNDFYKFLDHGYEDHTKWYTPTRLGTRLEAHGWIKSFHTKGIWNEIVEVF